jgi:hypothetical protein
MNDAVSSKMARVSSLNATTASSPTFCSSTEGRALVSRQRCGRAARVAAMWRVSARNVSAGSAGGVHVVVNVADQPSHSSLSRSRSTASRLSKYR